VHTAQVTENAVLTTNLGMDCMLLKYAHWKTLCQNAGHILPVTLFCTLLSSFQVLLHQHQFSGHLQQEEQPVQQTQTCLKVQQVNHVIQVQQQPQSMSMWKRNKPAPKEMTFIEHTDSWNCHESWTYTNHGGKIKRKYFSFNYNDKFFKFH
jgi:hypothetical protein